MLRRFLLPTIILSLSACATSREARFAKYRDHIQEDHDSQLCRPDRTPIADRMDSPDYRDRFKATVCEGLEASDCRHEFLQAVFVQLRDKYFAADHSKVSETCSHDPVDCTLAVWEAMACRAHNTGIEWHRAQALAGLEALEAGRPLTAYQSEGVAGGLKSAPIPKTE